MDKKADNILVIIKKFFLNIFSKNRKKLLVESTDKNLENNTFEKENISYNVNKNDNFINNLKIKKDEEEERILKIQEDLENKIIQVENISEEDFNKVLELYDKQTEEIEANTERLNKLTDKYKNEIIKIRKELKNSV